MSSVIATPSSGSRANSGNHSQLLLVAGPADRQADRLSRRLIARGCQFTRLTDAALPFGADLTLHHAAGSQWEGKVVVLDNGRTVRLDQVRAVWWRGLRPGCVSREVSASDVDFVHSELHHALGAAWQMMTCLWMNHPNSVQLASYKFEQLSRARSFNFATPDTVVTNSVEAARAFVERHGGTCVYKLLTASAVAMYTRPEKTGMVSRGFSCPTTIVSARELSARGSLGGAPCQFQELIDKRREFRVTVIGDQVFAVRLELREPSRSEPDWRRLWTRETTKVVTLPSAVSDGCRAIAGSYGLTFAAIDLVESQDGTLFFLELNPIGQYLYLEGLHPELPLCDATIDVLLREAP